MLLKTLESLSYKMSVLSDSPLEYIQCFLEYDMNTKESPESLKV